MENNQTNTRNSTEVSPQENTENTLGKGSDSIKKESSVEDFKAYFQKASVSGFVIQLPVCGLSVRVGTPDMINLFLQGRFPTEMLQTALQLKGLAPKKSMSSMTQEELVKMNSFISEFFCAAVISPEFTVDSVNNPDKLDASNIDIQDKFVVLELINRGVDSLERFRRNRTGKATGHNSKKVRKDS